MQLKVLELLGSWFKAQESWKPWRGAVGPEGPGYLWTPLVLGALIWIAH